MNRPLVMGVVNVTPDSFSDGGRFLGQGVALAHARRLITEGADILDIGGESTRPGAEPVSESEEAARVAPLIAALRAESGIPISADTMKPGVAAAACAVGATVWNDVTALTWSTESLETAAEIGCEVVLMHMRGEPRTMQAAPRYDDVVAEVAGYLVARAEAAIAAGIARDRIWLDPGIGFGKTALHSLALMRNLGRIVALGFPVLVGASRKSNIARIARDTSTADQRLAGSIAMALAAATAGVQADIKTVTALGGYAASAITAITVQDTLGVQGVHPVPPEVVAAQIRAVLTDIGADAIKTGMLGEADVAAAVVEALADWPDIPLVVDPVMVAKGGARLISEAALVSLRRLMARAVLITPNAPEAEALTGLVIADTGDLRRAGEALLTSGVRAVLMKGGHVAGDSVIDLLMTPEGETLFESPRIETRHTHGTGCTLASACAAGLAQGLPLTDAVARAWAYTGEAIRRAPGFGSGRGPLDHAWPTRGR